MELEEKTTEATAEEEGNAEAIGGVGAILLLPAAGCLHFLDHIGWLALTSVVVGLLGVAVLIAAVVVGIKEKAKVEMGAWAISGAVVVTAKFAVDAGQFLF